MDKRELKVGEIMQLSPTMPLFGACLFVVTEPKPWGAQGYVQAFGTEDAPGGQAYLRPRFDEMEPTGGTVQWILE